MGRGEKKKRSGYRVASVSGAGSCKPAASPCCSSGENPPAAALASQRGPKASQLSSTYTAGSHLGLNKNTGLCSNQTTGALCREQHQGSAPPLTPPQPLPY